MKKIMGTKQAAKYLGQGCDTRTIRGLSRMGVLPYTQLGKTTWLYDQEDLDNLAVRLGLKVQG